MTKGRVTTADSETEIVVKREKWNAMVEFLDAMNHAEDEDELHTNGGRLAELMEEISRFAGSAPTKGDSRDKGEVDGIRKNYLLGRDNG